MLVRSSPLPWRRFAEDRERVKPYTHPGKPELVMARYRRHILGCKKKWGTARSLIHYRALLDEYLAAKRVVIASELRRRQLS